MTAKPEDLLLDEESLDRALDELLQQEKYRWCCGCTNVKQFTYVMSIIFIIIAALTLPGNIFGSIIVIVAYGLAIRALRSKGRYTSLTPAIVLHIISAVLVIIVLIGALLLILFAGLGTWERVQKSKQSTAALVLAAVLTTIYLLLIFKLQLWFLRAFRKAEEFLKEASELRTAALARMNPV